jgi:hypothetical protein
MKQLSSALWLLLWAANAAPADPFVVAPEVWDRPRTARVIYEQPAIKQAIAAYLAQPVSAQLVIHHAIAPDAGLQAEELRTWLMVLGVDAGRVRLINDLPPGQPLTIEVVQ